MKRLTELEAIRGIAALVVVLHHCWEAVWPDQNTFPLGVDFSSLSRTDLRAAYIISVSPLRLLFSGHAAVGLFFVLSGLVLTKSLQGTEQAGYAPFAIRRVFRIWMPFAVAILAAATLQLLIAPKPLAGRDWLNSSWSTPVTPSLMAGHLLMLGVPGYMVLNNPMWSLVHEMRVSMVFPFLCAFTKRYPVSTVIGASALFTVLSIRRLVAPLSMAIEPELVRLIALSLVDTVRYVMFFVFGILIAINFGQMSQFLARSRVPRGAMWAVCLVLLMLPATAGYMELNPALGSAGLLVLCLTSPRATRLLQHPSLTWLGKVSYGLYLTHLLVLLTVVHLLYDVVPIYVVLMADVVCSLMVAVIVHRFIELPFNDVGKRLARRIAVNGCLAAEPASHISLSPPISSGS